MNSAFYSGWVRHRRLRPKAHEFRYRIGLLYLDLAEQDALFALSPLLGRGRFAPLSFRERDYLPHLTGQGLPLLEAVRQSLSEALGAAPEGRICLLTQPRCWGLSFNPVSFFYCFDAEERLAAILCEVSNTPWHQRYHYVLPADGAGSRTSPWPSRSTSRRSCRAIWNTTCTSAAPANAWACTWKTTTSRASCSTPP